MIDVKANGNKTLMQIYGDPSDIADELAHIVTHVTERIILLGKDKDDRFLTIFAAGSMSCTIRATLRRRSQRCSDAAQTPYTARSKSRVLIRTSQKSPRKSTRSLRLLLIP